MSPAPGADGPSYDYIVVGAGSAGCIVAAGLIEDPGVTVLLLEAGDRAEANPETLRADGYKDAFVNDALLYDRFSEPQPGCAGRRVYVGTGRGVGGSGAVNAMVYTRGDAADYDDWGTDGWRWADVAPRFEALERALRPRRMPPTAFTEACIAAAEARGFARKADLNDGALRGFLGYEWMNLEGNERRSSYVTFLRDRRDAPGLTLATGARCRRVRFEGTRAAAVEYERDGQVIVAAARREVILCAGALETPRILLLSGVGPRAALEALGIEVVADRAGVGENLQDHPNVVLFSRGRAPTETRWAQLYGFHRAGSEHGSPLAPGQADSCYVFYAASSSFREGVIRLLPSMILPRALYQIAGVRQALRALIAAVFALGFVKRLVERMYGVVVILGKPRSRGSVRLASANPDEPARVDPGYFTAPGDLDALTAGVALARGVADAPALAAWGNRELIPGRRSRGPALERWIRRNAITTYHFAGTCRMGHDADAVVDADLRVREVQALRVADASIIPVVPVSALNAPTMMIALRAVELLKDPR